MSLHIPGVNTASHAFVTWAVRGGELDFVYILAAGFSHAFCCQIYTEAIVDHLELDWASRRWCCRQCSERSVLFLNISIISIWHPLSYPVVSYPWRPGLPLNPNNGVVKFGELAHVVELFLDLTLAFYHLLTWLSLTRSTTAAKSGQRCDHVDVEFDALMSFIQVFVPKLNISISASTYLPSCLLPDRGRLWIRSKMCKVHPPRLNISILAAAS